ncbi:MAG: hypothetical protein ACREV2_17035, partial [Burkholderiales bacterium]
RKESTCSAILGAASLCIVTLSRIPDGWRRSSSARPVWYTFPDREMPYPQGLKSAAFEFNPAKFLKIPATAFVGENDIRRDDALNTSRGLDSHQGETRVERGRRWIEAMRAAAAAHQYDTRFEFHTLPWSDHSFFRSVRRGFLAGRVFESLGLDKPAPRRV